MIFLVQAETKNVKIVNQFENESGMTERNFLNFV